MSQWDWVDRLFSTESRINALWENLTKTPCDSGLDLTEIVYGPFQEELKKRALFLLLVPDVKVAPFAWKHQKPSHYLNTKLDFQKVEAGLRSSAIYWLTKFIDYARQAPSPFKTAYLDAYNNYIVQLLSVIPAEDNQAETLFSYFSINDASVWIDIKNALAIETNSGFNPLVRLWQNAQINEKWKKLADLEIRQIIKKELRGQNIPRAPWENALQCYAEHLQSLLPPEQAVLPYSKELFAGQIGFLIALEVSNLHLVRPESIKPILAILAEKKFQDIRRRFILFIVICDGSFTVHDEQSEKTAELMIGDCHDEVRQLLSDKIENYRKTEKS